MCSYHALSAFSDLHKETGVYPSARKAVSGGADGAYKTAAAPPPAAAAAPAPSSLLPTLAVAAAGVGVGVLIGMRLRL